MKLGLCDESHKNRTYTLRSRRVGLGVDVGWGRLRQPGLGKRTILN